MNFHPSYRGYQTSGASCNCSCSYCMCKHQSLLSCTVQHGFSGMQFYTKCAVYKWLFAVVDSKLCKIKMFILCQQMLDFQLKKRH